jgi:hypothetical protein
MLNSAPPEEPDDEGDDLQSKVVHLFPKSSGGAFGPPPPKDPGSSLMNLRLPAQLVRRLTPGLRVLGYTIEPHEAENRHGGLKRPMSKVSRHGDVEPFYCIHVADWIIRARTGRRNKDDRQHDEQCLLALASLRVYFERNSRVFVFSRDLEIPGSPFDRALRSWQSDDVHAFFVPWTRVEELSGRRPHLQDDARTIAEMFRIEVGQEQRRPAPERTKRQSQPVDPQSSERIVEAVLAEADAAGSYSTDIRYFYNSLLSELHLPQRWQEELKSQWSSNSRSNAQVLVKYLLRRSYYPRGKDGGQSTLGALIRILMRNMGDLWLRGEIADIARRYELLPASDVENLLNQAGDENDDPFG